MAKMIDAALLSAMRPELDAAVAAVGAKFGVELKFGAGSYTANSFTLKLDGKTEGGLSKEEELYDVRAEFMGLPPRGTVFKFGATPYRTKGLRQRSTKMTVERVSDDKEFVIPISDVIACVNAQKASTPTPSL